MVLNDLDIVLINSFLDISVLHNSKNIINNFYSKIFQRKLPNDLKYDKELLFKLSRICLTKNDIKDNFPKLKKYVMENSKLIGNFHEEITSIKRKDYIVDIEKRIYYIITKITPTEYCSCGNLRWFKDFKFGYHSCKKGSSCLDIINAKKERMRIKTGYDSNFQDPKCKEKIKQTNTKKLGVPYPMMSNKVLKKSINTCNEKYGCNNSSQKHLSKEIINLYNSKEDFIKKLDELTFTGFIKKYNIESRSLRRCIDKFEINYDYSRSILEIEMKQFLEDNNINFIQNSKTIIYPLELDFYLEEYNLGIEMNGLYWHSDIHKDKNYHLNKYKICKENNIRLVSINEDEWNNKNNIIKNKILNIMKKSKKGIYARKCKVIKITNKIANDFCEKYHIQGKNTSILKSYGAYYENKLIGVLCYNKQRGTNEWELIRFCSNGENNPGLFSKLFKFSIKDFNPNKIISFADLRYSEGNLYEKNGFIKEKTIGPDYRYVKGDKTYHKSSFKKSKIKKKFNLNDNEINSNTEKQLMEELGYHRIYDIGKIKYIWKCGE